MAIAGGGGGCFSWVGCSGNAGGDGGTPDGANGTTTATCGNSVGGGATQTSVGVSSFNSPNTNGQGMNGGYYAGGGGGGVFGGAGSEGAGGGGGSSNYNVAGATVAGFTFVSGSGAYGVAASAVSGSVSITYTLGQNPWIFPYIADAAQSYKIPSGTQYLDFVVTGYAYSL